MRYFLRGVQDKVKQVCLNDRYFKTSCLIFELKQDKKGINRGLYWKVARKSGINVLLCTTSQLTVVKQSSPWARRDFESLFGWDL